MTLSLSFHEFQVCYWTSFAKQCGVELCSSGGLTLCTEYLQRLVPHNDDLIQRPLLERNVITSICKNYKILQIFFEAQESYCCILPRVNDRFSWNEDF